MTLSYGEPHHLPEVKTEMILLTGKTVRRETRLHIVLMQPKIFSAESACYEVSAEGSSSLLWTRLEFKSVDHFYQYSLLHLRMIRR